MHDLGTLLIMLGLFGLASVAVGPTEEVTPMGGRTINIEGANAFHEYCGKCHALPDIRNTLVPPYMYNYVRAFGATDIDIMLIKQYVYAVSKGGADDE